MLAAPGSYTVTAVALDAAGIALKTWGQPNGFQPRIVPNGIVEFGANFDFRTATTASIAVIWTVNGMPGNTACPTDGGVSVDLDANTPAYKRVNTTCLQQQASFTMVPAGVHTIDTLLIDNVGTHLATTTGSQTVVGGINSQVFIDFVY